MRLHRFALFWGILCLGLLSVLTLLYTAARVSDVVLVPFVRAELVAGGGGRAAGNGLAVVQVMAPHSGLLIRRLNSSTHDSSAATPTFSSVDHSQQHTPGELDVDLDLAELRDGRVHVTDDYESIPTPPPANLSSQLLNLLSDRWHSSLLSEGKSSILHEFLEGSHNREMAHLRQMFPLAPNFTLPNPQVSLPPSDLDYSRWMLELRRHLSTLGKSKRINMVTSNSIYQDVLLNWLISAAVRSQLPLQSILVISLSQSLHTKLVERKIPSVYIPYFSLLRRGINFTQDFEKVMMLRLAVMRLLNHWGFDVHNYDTDAVLLKDPQPLYDRFAESDIIGSVGKIPRNLMAFWGITVCIGVVILKSNPHTEVYWQRVSTICLSSHDDQEKLNCGLKALRITWDKAHSNHNTTVVEGKCSSGLTVSILPYDYICRLDTCDPTRRSDYYIWHKGGTRSRREKLKGSREGQTWFLRYKWNKIKNRLTGIRWLESIAYWEVTHS